MSDTFITIISKGSKQLEKSFAEIKLNGKKLLPPSITQEGLNLVLLNSKLEMICFRFYNLSQFDLNQKLVQELENIPDQTIIIMTVRRDIHQYLNKSTRTYLQKHFHSQYIHKVDKYHSWCYLGQKYQNKIYHLAEAHKDPKKNSNKIAKIDNYYDLSFENIQQTLDGLVYTYDISLIRSSPVKEKMKILTTQLRKLKNIEARVSLMKNYFQGEKCYIISCAPSINDYDPKMIKRIAGQNLVFCIKQAYNLFPEICDFHILNFCNNIKYTYQRPSVARIYQSNNNSVDHEADLSFTLDKPYLLSKFRTHQHKYPPLSKLMNFEDYLLEKKIHRPSGPGIMYEIPIYLAIHLGIKEIVVLGWDCSYANIKSKEKTNMLRNSHFYGSNAHTSKELDKIVNENIDIVHSSKYFYFWLQSKGVDLKLASNQSLLDPIIPRLNLKDFYIPSLNRDLEQKDQEQKEQKENLNQKENDSEWKTIFQKKFDELEKQDHQLFKLKKKLKGHS